MCLFQYSSTCTEWLKTCSVAITKMVQAKEQAGAGVWQAAEQIRRYKLQVILWLM